MKKLIIICSLALMFGCGNHKTELENKISEQETLLLNDSTHQLDKRIAEEVLADYLRYVKIYKKDTLCPVYLFRAGDLANGLGKPDEAIKIFEQLRSEYPKFPKNGSALFMEGFIYETALNDVEKAKIVYKAFLKDYPDHKLRTSAEASLAQFENGLTNEELIKQFEQNQDSTASK